MAVVQTDSTTFWCRVTSRLALLCLSIGTYHSDVVVPWQAHYGTLLRPASKPFIQNTLWMTLDFFASPAADIDHISRNLIMNTTNALLEKSVETLLTAKEIVSLTSYLEQLQHKKDTVDVELDQC